MEKRRRRVERICTVLAIIIMLLAFIPIFTMIFLSLKSNAQIYGDFFSLPRPVMWSNYNKAIDQLIPNMVNTLIIIIAAVFFTLVLSVVGGYVFSQLDFPGKNLLFLLILSLMMVPLTLTLTPQYILVQKYGMYNTWWALILPWTAGAMPFGIYLCRTFMEGIPKELFEAAEIDGCSKVNAIRYIVVPLSKSIIATVAVIKTIDYYNDFIWPLISIETNSKQVINVAIRLITSDAQGNMDIGSMMAGFVFATIPLFIMFVFTSRLYMEGLTAGAVKG